MAWKDSMPYVTWTNMSGEEQQIFLDTYKIEVRGYTLMGRDPQPTDIEFQSVSTIREN